MAKRWMVAMAVAMLVAVAATSAQAPRSLYDRIGGEPAIRKVVDEFVAKAAGNPKVNFLRNGRFAASDAFVTTLKTHLVNFLGGAFGGPQKYTGRTMKAAHQGMGITAAEFSALAADLEAVLVANRVPQTEIAAIMKIAAATAADIVERP